MKFALFIFSLLYVGCTSASPAGVIPYACISGDPYILLAFDPVSTRVGYAAFGGGREGNETIAQTAAREFHEETRCAFDTPSAEQLQNLTPSLSHGYYSYVAEIPFIGPLAITEHPCEARIERYDYQWVRLSDLIAGLEKEEARPEVLVSLMHKYITLWGKSAESLRQAMQDGLLPQQGLC
jgi:ADP-ribose pyrophosphatase YjhB (NUDIX family)